MTALDDSEHDLLARIGWMLRVSRLVRGVTLAEARARLRDLGVSVSLGALSEVERGLPRAGRRGELVDGYEAILGLYPGALRAAVDIMCRTFSFAPPDRSPALAVTDRHRDLDDALERVAGPDARGSDWLRFARIATDDHGVLLPTRFVRPLLERLLDEMLRAVGPAYFTRYEAISRLQDGRYAATLRAVVDDLLGDAGGRSMSFTAITLVSDRPDRDVLVWLLDLLDSSDDTVRAAAASGLANARHAGGIEDDDWRLVVAPYVAAYRSASGSADRREVLARLHRNLPARERRAIERHLGERPSMRFEPASWVADERANEHWALCARLGRSATDRLGIPEQPLLHRILFEVMFEFRSHVTTSAWLLASSELAPAVASALLPCLEPSEPEVVRVGALRALYQMATPAADGVLRDWWAARPPEDRRRALSLAENYALPLGVAERALADDDEHGDAVVRALGAAGDQALREVHRTTSSAERRAVAGWWLRGGPRVAT